MTTDIKELVKRLRDGDCLDIGAAAEALEAMAGEVERITKERDDLDANGIHTCHDNCTKHFCVMRRRMQAAESERDRLAGEVAIVRSARDMHHANYELMKAHNKELFGKLSAAELERDRLKAALETIAEEHDAGRHDGLPEPCPAHDADTMFYLARKALGGDA